MEKYNFSDKNHFFLRVLYRHKKKIPENAIKIKSYQDKRGGGDCLISSDMVQ